MPSLESARPSLSGDWISDLKFGWAIYCLSTIPVLFGAYFGLYSAAAGNGEIDFLAACVQFDAEHYVAIVRDGYSYSPDRRSLVAFFPAFPLLARGLGFVTGLTPEEAAMVVANCSLIASLALFGRWIRAQWPEVTDTQLTWSAALFGLWPMGLFFRMPYAESLLLFTSLLLLYGMSQRWPIAVLALLAGLVSAIRPVGVAAGLAVLWYQFSIPSSGYWMKTARSVFLLCLAGWGLLAYALFQQVAFGDAIAFARTQQHWHLGVATGYTWQDKAIGLATLEPLWGVYDSSSPRYWSRNDPCVALFNVGFWNPICFSLTAALLAIGWFRRWLTGPEIVFGAALLAIPYVTRAYEMSFASHGRFSAVVVVAYLPLGRLFANVGSYGRLVCGLTLGILMAFLSARYVTGKPVF